MTKKSKGRKKVVRESKDGDDPDVPIPNLPDKFLWMHVNSGTKIRNVLNYALKEFPNYKSVLWSGAGQGIGKVITCVELCKKKNPGLHQITKLRYTKSKNAEIAKDDNEDRNVPEIHILLAKDPLNSQEPGYQSSDDNQGLFPSKQFNEKTKLLSSNNELGNQSSSSSPASCLMKESQQESSTSKLSIVATKEFAAMGLRTGQKRSHKLENKLESNNSSGNKMRKKGKKN